MAHPLMPKATAVWLVDNTTLSFEQIAAFCGIHELEVQAIADGEVAVGMQGMDPVLNGELQREEIERCEQDPVARLKAAKPSVPLPKARQKGARYTPVSKRGDRPNAIAWLLKNYPELSDAQISRVIGTTKPTINAVRDRTHWNTPNIKPQNPVSLGLCTEAELQKVVDVARARAGTVAAPKAEAEAEPAAMASVPAETVPEKAAEPTAENLFGGGAPAEAEPQPEEPTAESVFGTPSAETDPAPAAPPPAETPQAPADEPPSEPAPSGSEAGNEPDGPDTALAEAFAAAGVAVETSEEDASGEEDDKSA